MQNAIIIGASSGIGRSLAEILVGKGYRVGVTGRRTDLLESLRILNPDKVFTLRMDVQDIESLESACEALTTEMGCIDLMVISAGIGIPNRTLDFQKEHDVIRTNILGFTCIADWAMRRFQSQGHGHLVNISSIASLRGNGHAPSYNATKAYQANYLEGLRLNADKTRLPIHVTDIRPGFVDTDMAKGMRMFWMSTPEKAATQIADAIQRKRRVAFVTRRWVLVAWLLQWIPYPLLRRVV
ncbi:MAG: SDR family NAD(P)-dependent oxidoreductase [Bacteroidetes bacterium]|nr:SDR family NAD(P)-dependent oxidoreductase [Bacteroidota bacterium]